MNVKAIEIIKPTAIAGQPVDEGDTLIVGHDIDADDAKALVKMKRAEYLDGDELAAAQKEFNQRLAEAEKLAKARAEQEAKEKAEADAKAKAEQEAKEKAEADAKAKAEQGKQKEGKGNA